jgi:hypothetical protein
MDVRGYTDQHAPRFSGAVRQRLAISSDPVDGAAAQ